MRPREADGRFSPRSASASGIADRASARSSRSRDRFIVVFHAQGGWYAVDDCCTHDGGPLGEGKLEGFTVACPGTARPSTFATARPSPCPPSNTIASHPVKVDDGEVLLRLDS